MWMLAAAFEPVIIVVSAGFDIFSGDPLGGMAVSLEGFAGLASELMALAGELGIADWPQPAGGCCYLTDEAFARKFFDVVDAREALGEPRRLTPDDVVLLSTGRHFRLSPRARLVVGRSEVENALLEHYLDGRSRVEARGLSGPVALVEGEPTWEDRILAARIVARYGKGKDLSAVEVEWREGDLVEVYPVEPFRDEAALESPRV